MHIIDHSFFSSPDYPLQFINFQHECHLLMPNTKHHDPTLPVEDASIFIATCLPFFFFLFLTAGNHIYIATLAHALNANFKKFCLNSHRHLHQHQQSFVTLHSPSLFYAAPQIRCIPQITYPELEAEEPRAFHKRRQLAEPLIYLSIFHSAIMRKLIQTSCINSPVLTWSSASVQSIYLLHIACSSAPSKNCPPCTHKSIRPTLIRI